MIVTCNGCGKKAYMWEVIDRWWIFDKKDYCPNCAKKKNEEEELEKKKKT